MKISLFLFLVKLLSISLLFLCIHPCHIISLFFGLFSYYSFTAYLVSVKCSSEYELMEGHSPLRGDLHKPP